MKYFIFCIAVLTGLWACNGSYSNNSKMKNIAQDTANYTTIQWIDSVQNFGTARFGDMVNIKYTFKNTGDKPLYIIDVQPTCGCTIADYTQTAVMPGNAGVVRAVYDSRHDSPGVVNKNIIVTSNAKNAPHFVLAFTGTVAR